MGKNLIFMRKLKVYVHLSILFLSLVSFVPNVGCLLLMIYLNIYEVTTFVGDQEYRLYSRRISIKTLVIQS